MTSRRTTRAGTGSGVGWERVGKAVCGARGCRTRRTDRAGRRMAKGWREDSGGFGAETRHGFGRPAALDNVVFILLFPLPLPLPPPLLCSGDGTGLENGIKGDGLLHLHLLLPLPRPATAALPRLCRPGLLSGYLNWSLLRLRCLTHSPTSRRQQLS